MPGGRPTLYTKELADVICQRLSEGLSMRTVCKDEDMPCAATLFTWMRIHPEFLVQYTRAKEESADNASWLRGFLTPLYEFDDIHEFVLVPNHMSCCFGMPTGINGQVQVKLSSTRGLPNTNEPLEVKGTFHAVETKEQGYLLSIWRIDGATARIVGY